MPWSVELYFDDATDRAIRRVWEALDDRGLGVSLRDLGFRPHVTLGICETLDERPFALALSDFAVRTRRLPVVLSSVGIFPTTPANLFFATTPTFRVLRMHRDLHEVVLEPTATRLQPYYVPGRWVPHCTVAQGVTEARLPQVLELLRRFPLPLHGSFASIGLVGAKPAVQRLLFPLG